MPKKLTSFFSPNSAHLPWTVTLLLMLGMILAYADRVNLSVALPEMTKDFPLDPTAAGLALSAFFWSYALLQIPAGWLVDRFGVRWPYVLGIILWSFASAGTALTTTLGWLLAMRILLGVGESVVTPASFKYLRMHFEEKKRGLAVGIYMAGTKIGPAIGFPLAAYLMALYGWKAMFLIVGLSSLIWVPPYLWLVRRNDIAAAARPKSVQGSQAGISWGVLLRSPVMWGTFIGTFCYMYFVYYNMTWMPSYFKRVHGMSIEEMGWYSGFAFGGMAIVAALGGWAADMFIARGYDPVNVRKGFTLAGFLLASTQTIGTFTDSVSLMIFFSIFSLCGLGLTTANYWALTQTLIPTGSIGTVVGFQNTAANLAGIVAPWLTGWMIAQTGSFNTPIMAIGFWLALGATAYVFLVRQKYAPAAEPAALATT